MEEGCSQRQAKKWLQELQLADGGNAALRQPLYRNTNPISMLNRET